MVCEALLLKGHANSSHSSLLNIPFTYSKSTPMIREIKQGQVVSYMRESKHLRSKSRPLSG